MAKSIFLINNLVRLLLILQLRGIFTYEKRISIVYRCEK